MPSIERQHYVYVHRRASDGSVFYVGKGKGRRAWCARSRSRYWQFVAAKHGFEPTVLRREMPEHCALSLERAVIAAIGRDKLTNATDGGGGITGWRHSDEAKRKISAASNGREFTQKMRDTLAAYNADKVLTPEHIEKMRAAKLGKKYGPMPAERRAKIAASHIGIRPSDEARRKMSLAKIGKAVGRDSPTYDHTERRFIHCDGGEFIGTRADFIRTFNLSAGCVSNLINGYRKSVKGWSIP
jgi:hypothetical protein